jgi:hypothetical protein
MFLNVIVEHGKGLLLFGHVFKSGGEWMGDDGGFEGWRRWSNFS